MFRFLILSAGLALAGLPATAQMAPDPISAEIAAKGLRPVRDRLAAMSARSDAENFALGGLSFLSAVETALQTRYRLALSPDISVVPVLRLPVPPNPSPAPFTAPALTEMVRAMRDDVGSALPVLDAIPETSDFGLALRIADIWFDIDANGVRGEGETLYEVLGQVMFGRTGFDPAQLDVLVVRFDLADSRWLSAYANLVAATASAILAYDPTDAIRRAMDAKAALAEVNKGEPLANGIDMMVGSFVDVVAVAKEALSHQPDRDEAARALMHLEAVVDRNRAFWRLVAAETDDAAEWIPNDAQQSAMGLRFPKGTGAAWQEVLTDADRMLKGELLLPYWRLSAGAGLNLRKMFLDPRPVDVVDWIQGVAAVPYAERGPRISTAAWWRFNDLMQGRGLLFAAVLN
jgi:hypothetical protein